MHICVLLLLTTTRGCSSVTWVLFLLVRAVISLGGLGRFSLVDLAAMVYLYRQCTEPLGRVLGLSQRDGQTVLGVTDSLEDPGP